MITYLLIGLAHTIIVGIYVSISFKNNWVSAKENANHTYSEMGWNVRAFSGEEFYRGFCVGLILSIIIWPIIDLVTIYLYIIMIKKNNH